MSTGTLFCPLLQPRALEVPRDDSVQLTEAALGIDGGDRFIGFSGLVPGQTETPCTDVYRSLRGSWHMLLESGGRLPS